MFFFERKMWYVLRMETKNSELKKHGKTTKISDYFTFKHKKIKA